jgi:hypothetical protein
LGSALGGVLACAGLVLAPPCLPMLGLERAHASLVLALDLPTMVQRADHIAVVDVGAVTAAWDEKHERILTTIDLAVVESWKGPMAPSSHVKVVQPGGSVGDIQMTVFGMPAFATGERSLVFLRGAPTAASVVGMAQGKRVLSRDAATGRWMVRAPERAGASFVRAPGAAPAGTPPVFDTRLRGLDDLRTEVRGLVAGGGGGRATGK